MMCASLYQTIGDGVVAPVSTPLTIKNGSIATKKAKMALGYQIYFPRIQKTAQSTAKEQADMVYQLFKFNRDIRIPETTNTLENMRVTVSKEMFGK